LHKPNHHAYQSYHHEHHHGNHYEETNPLKPEQDKTHERKTVDHSSSSSQSYDSSHPCIEHEVESVYKTDHLQTHHANHQNHDHLNKIEHRHEHEKQTDVCPDLHQSDRRSAPV
jgi:hypothetical protein